MGFEEMDDDYRIQKAKYCNCMANFIYIKQKEKSLRDNRRHKNDVPVWPQR